MIHSSLFTVRESLARSASVLETIYAAGRAQRPTCLIWTRALRVDKTANGFAPDGAGVQRERT